MTVRDNPGLYKKAAPVFLSEGVAVTLNDFAVDQFQRKEALRQIIEICAIEYDWDQRTNRVTFKSNYANLEVTFLSCKDGAIVISAERKVPSPTDFIESYFISRYAPIDNLVTRFVDSRIS